MLEYVSFDDSKSFKGLNNLKPILIALAQKRKLKFVHENYMQKTFKNYEITPFLLKEYENRWYIIGVPEGMEEIRTFGVDRISQISLGSNARLKKQNFENQLKVFDNIIGLDYENNKPVPIRLLVNGLHINYMKSLPIHHSQVIHPIDENEQHFVDFFLVPNYEFKTQVLKMGEEAVVIAPDEFRDEIKNMLQSTLERYK